MKAIEEMSVHELHERKNELLAELGAVGARLRELDAETTYEQAIAGYREKQARYREQMRPASEPNPIPIVGQPGGPNAHVEGADAASQDDGA